MINEKVEVEKKMSTLGIVKLMIGMYVKILLLHAEARSSVKYLLLKPLLAIVRPEHVC